MGAWTLRWIPVAWRNSGDDFDARFSMVTEDAKSSDLGFHRSRNILQIPLREINHEFPELGIDLAREGVRDEFDRKLAGLPGMAGKELLLILHL